MTLPRLAVIAERWERVPPLSVSVACIAQALGAKPGRSSSKRDDAANEGSMDELMSIMGGGVNGFNSELPQWLRDQQAQKT